MKNYRCPWCVSRTNHNILYFVHISRTSPLNTAICLWKVAIGLVRRGVARPNLPQNQGKSSSNSWQYAWQSRPTRGPTAVPPPPSKPSPGLGPAQGAEPVQIRAPPVRVVEIRANCAAPDGTGSASPAKLLRHLHPKTNWPRALAHEANSMGGGLQIYKYTGVTSSVTGSSSLTSGHHNTVHRERRPFPGGVLFDDLQSRISCLTWSQSSSRRTIYARRTPTPGRTRLPVICQQRVWPHSASPQAPRQAVRTTS